MLQARDISSVEVTQAFLARIEELNGDGGFSVASRRPGTDTTPNPDIPVYGNNGSSTRSSGCTSELALRMARDADGLLDAAAGAGAAASAAACRSRSRTSSPSPASS